MKIAFSINGKPIFKYGDYGKSDTYNIHAPQLRMIVPGLSSEAAWKLIVAWDNGDPVTVVQDIHNRADLYVFWQNR